MIIEVNDTGQILIPAELVQAPPHTRLKADREGDAVVLKPVPEKITRKTSSVSSLPVLESHLSNGAMTVRRADIYDSGGR